MSDTGDTGAVATAGAIAAEFPTGFQGARLLPPTPEALAGAATVRSAGDAAAVSFFISNRTLPFDENDTQPIAGGAINWYMSDTRANDPVAANYTAQGSAPTTAPPSAFTTALVAALEAQSTPQLAIFVHGLSTPFDAAIEGAAAVGANLAAYGNYAGLVVGFDWPSYDEIDSMVWYAPATYAFPLPTTEASGTIRGNINGTANPGLQPAGAFANLVGYLTKLRSSVKNGVSISLICHSEGNYLAMLGLSGSTTKVFDQILLVAADINTGAMQQAAASDPLIGQGSGIVASASNGVTVYFSTADEVLPASIAAYSKPSRNRHNPQFGGRLGSSGPAYDVGSTATGMVSVDCSQVVNVANVGRIRAAQVAPATTAGGAAQTISLHTSYFYIPQVLADMATVLANEPFGDRQATANIGAYVMVLEDAGT